MIPFNSRKPTIDTDEEGKLVRTPDGSRRWYRDGVLHRKSGPAFESIDGTQMWYRDGKLHREDGPALIQPDGEEQYWLNARRVEKRDFEQALRQLDRERRDARRAEEDRKQRAADEKHEKTAAEVHSRLRRPGIPKIGKPPQP